MDITHRNGRHRTAGLWFAKQDADLLRQRLFFPVYRDQPVWDKALLYAFIGLCFASFVIMALVRWRATRWPVWGRRGAACILLSYVVGWRTLAENSLPPLL
jgi:hypothetical protein